MYDWSFISFIWTLFRLSQNKLYMTILILLMFDDNTVWHIQHHNPEYEWIMQRVTSPETKANRPTENILEKKTKTNLFIRNVMKLLEYKCVKCYDCSETWAVGNIIVVQNLQTLLQTDTITEQLMIWWLKW